MKSLLLFLVFLWFCLLFKDYLSAYKSFYIIFPFVVFSLNFLFYFFCNITVNKNFIVVRRFFWSRVFDYSKWDVRIVYKNSKYLSNCYLYFDYIDNSRKSCRVSLSNFDSSIVDEINYLLVKNGAADEHNDFEKNIVSNVDVNSYHFDNGELIRNIKEIRSKKLLSLIVCYYCVSIFFSLIFVFLHYQNDSLLFTISILFCIPCILSFLKINIFLYKVKNLFLHDIIFGSCLLIDDVYFNYDDVVSIVVSDELDSFGYTCRKLCIKNSRSDVFEYIIDYYKDFTTFHYYDYLYGKFDKLFGSKFINVKK